MRHTWDEERHHSISTNRRVSFKLTLETFPISYIVFQHWQKERPVFRGAAPLCCILNVLSDCSVTTLVIFWCLFYSLHCSKKYYNMWISHYSSTLTSECRWTVWSVKHQTADISTTDHVEPQRYCLITFKFPKRHVNVNQRLHGQFYYLNVPHYSNTTHFSWLHETQHNMVMLMLLRLAVTSYDCSASAVSSVSIASSR